MTNAAQVSAAQELLAAQRARFDATVARDVAALDRLLDDNLTYVHVSAHVDTKASFMDSVGSGRSSFTGFGVEEPVVRIFGDTGVITAKIEIRLRGAEGAPDRVLPVLCTDVWARDSAGWHEVAWQATRIPE